MMKTYNKESALTPRLLRRREVEARTGLSRSSIYARMGAGTFPPAVGLGGRCVCWVESEVDAWVKERIEARAPRTAARAAVSAAIES